MNLNIPELTEIDNKLSVILAKVDNRFYKEWYNDKDCWQIKGGLAWNTYRCNRFYQCKGGIPDNKVGGRKVWHRTSVIEWVGIPDSELETYHEKYKTGAKKGGTK